MVAHNSSTDQVERKTLMHAPRTRIWQALTDPKEFSQWFGVVLEGTFAPGASVGMTSTIPGYEGESGVLIIEEMTPEQRFAWRWHPGTRRPGVDYSKEPMTLVTFTLEEVEGGTLVTVRETGFDRIPASRHASVLEDNTKGWEYQMGSLQKYVGASS